MGQRRHRLQPESTGVTGAYHIPEPEFSGKNLSDHPVFLEATSYGVAEWTPGRNGEGKPEAVMLHFDMGGAFDGVTLGVRFKSRKEIQRCVTLLQQYSAMVFGKGGT